MNKFKIMKTNKPKITSKIFTVDHFWDDCIQEEKNQNDPLFQKYPEKNNKDYNNKTFINNCYKKLCNKIPNLKKEETNNIMKKRKSINSLKRSLLLYQFGLDHKKAIQNTFLENKLNKEKEELKLCTWKPKISKTNRTKGNLTQRRNREEIISRKNILEKINKKECTFRPNIITKNNDKNFKKVFNRSKSMVLFTDKENFYFMMRYKKAWDEHMIKRFKKLSVKDESYRNSFLEMTSRDCEQNYKNYLNVNNNIDLYDIELKTNYKDNKYIFNLSYGNNSDALSKRNQNKVSNVNKHKAKKYYIGMLKKQLSLIDLENF